MSHRRTKRDAEVAPFIANDDLEQRAIVASQDALHRSDEGIKPGMSIRVGVIVNPGKAQEERNSRSQLGEEGTLSC